MYFTHTTRIYSKHYGIVHGVKRYTNRGADARNIRKHLCSNIREMEIYKNKKVNLDIRIEQIISYYVRYVLSSYVSRFVYG